MPLIEDILDLAEMPSSDLPDNAIKMARFSLLDWMVCGWAGKDEPLAVKLRKVAAEEGGKGVATIIGAEKFPARMAALVNGATSHALDFDDTHFAHVGHLSVGIFPAALSVGEEVDAGAASVVEAFLVGAEAAIRIGLVLGEDHYNRGFHQTATAGAFGATIAAARLYGLDRTSVRVALGLCATRASGLKSQFGSMGKPYNAGIAASNGVECAKLASHGFTSTDDGLSDSQGFIPTHTAHGGHDAFIPTVTANTFLFEDNKYKFHACCHGTHAMIEGLQSAGLSGKGLSDVAAVTLKTNLRWLKVCDKKSPQSGLEVKFSYAWLAGMVMRGEDTGNDRTYIDALTQDSELVEYAKKVRVTGDPELSDLQAAGEVTMKDGRVISYEHDLEAALDENVLKAKLSAKAVSAIGEKGRIIKQQLENLDEIRARDIGALLSG